MAVQPPWMHLPWMKLPWMKLDERKRQILAIGSILAIVGGGLWFFTRDARQHHDEHQHPSASKQASKNLELNEGQVAALKIEAATERDFAQERHSVGNIDFNQNRLVVVFSHYQGRIIEAGPNVGDAVEKDQFLFSMSSPDLLSAEANLIAVAGTNVLHTRNLERAKSLVKIGGISQQAADQVISDQQTAEGAIRIARDNVRIFGKTDDEINKIITDRRADSQLVVKSPISGYVTARAAAPGLYVQPGVAPAPYTVADTSTMWMVANVVENDAPLLRVGQEVTATVAAFPDRPFRGKIIVLGASIDPNTRRVFARCEIDDPEHLLRAGMFANFIIRIGDPIRALSVHQNGVVREGDGSNSAWVTKDRKHFSQRTVKVGQRQGDYVQIVSGIEPGELVVTDGAVFLSNEAAITSID